MDQPPPPHHCSHPHHHHLVFYHPHHHHHHHHVMIMPKGKGTLRNNFSQNPNSKFCIQHLITPLPQIPRQPPQINPNFRSSYFQPPHISQDTQNFPDDVVVEFEEEPVFVMTDEWREFFAKSEARRREAKKLAKKQRKKT